VISAIMCELHLLRDDSDNHSDSTMNASDQAVTNHNTDDLQTHQIGSSVSRRKTHMKFNRRRRPTLLAKVCDSS